MRSRATRWWGRTWRTLRSRTRSLYASTTNCVGIAVCVVMPGCRVVPRISPRGTTSRTMTRLWCRCTGRVRDRYVLRLIAVERSVHVIVLSILAVAVFLFIGHRTTLRHDYVAIINGLFGASGGPDAKKGLLGDFRHLFVISPTHLYDIGFLLVAYATLEAVEMVGLWMAKRWAEYLTFVATLLFVPLEVYELVTAFGWLKLVTFLVNVAVVAYLALGKRLFGLRGGHAADVARREADAGWHAIESRPPGEPFHPL